MDWLLGIRSGHSSYFGCVATLQLRPSKAILNHSSGPPRKGCSSSGKSSMDAASSIECDLLKILDPFRLLFSINLASALECFSNGQCRAEELRVFASMKLRY